MTCVMGDMIVYEVDGKERVYVPFDAGSQKTQIHQSTSEKESHGTRVVKSEEELVDLINKYYEKSIQQSQDLEPGSFWDIVSKVIFLLLGSVALGPIGLILGILLINQDYREKTEDKHLKELETLRNEVVELRKQLKQ